MSTKQYFLIVFTLVLTILGAFYSGFFLRKTIEPEIDINNSSNQLFRPNFIDEAIFVTTEEPRKALIVSATRTYKNEYTNNYTVKAFYFNGAEWFKEINEGNSNKLENIPFTPIVPKWEIINDPSYMLKQSIVGQANINNLEIEFEIPVILNEMSIRSFYKYTKFMSETNGTIVIDGNKYLTKVLYSRIYSFNPPEGLIFTSDPSGIETEWLAFWDENNNFYSIDETTVDNKKTSEIYKAHSLAILKDEDEKIQKSFTLELKKNNTETYVVDIKERINKILNITKLNSINKSVNGVDIWLTGLVEGEIQTLDKNAIKGFGVYEQISQ